MPPAPVHTLEMTPQGVSVVGEDATLASASARLPPGAYTTLRTYGRRGIVRFEAHLRRLEESTAGQSHPASIDRNAARRLVGAALRTGGHPESRLRLTFAPPRLFASVTAFVPLPSSRYQEGVACLTLPRLHRDQPRVKDTRFIPTAGRAYAELPHGIEEALLLSEGGAILEGLSSNFFAVLGGVLRTEEERVLAGITRALVLDAAQPVAPVVRRAVSRSQLRQMEEAFITSASRGILPVVRIDDEPIGDGRVGGLTRAMTDAFASLVARERDDRF